MQIVLDAEVSRDLVRLAWQPGSVDSARVAQLAQALREAADRAHHAYVQARHEGERADARQVRDALLAGASVVASAVVRQSGAAP